MANILSFNNTIDWIQFMKCEESFQNFIISYFAHFCVLLSTTSWPLSQKRRDQNNIKTTNSVLGLYTNQKPWIWHLGQLFQI